MKKLIKLLVPSVLLLGALAPAWGQGTAFTYQGRLTDGCCPATGLYDLTFKLYDTPDALTPPNTQVGIMLSTNRVPVTNGLFTVRLDFGPNRFTGPSRWLQIGVRTNDPALSFVALAPRIEVTPAPYAIYAANAGVAVTASNIVSRTVSAPQLNTPIGPASGQVLAYNGTSLVWTNAGTASSGWLLGGNAGTTAGLNFLGTTDNQPLELKANGTRALRLEPNPDGAVNLIGGSLKNVVDAGVAGATISGGGADNYFESLPQLSGFVTAGANQLAADFSAIGGGGNNAISNASIFSVIAGGYLNTIETNSPVSTIGGGFSNTIQTNAAFSTIGGGLLNSAYGAGDFIGGGGFDGSAFGVAGNTIYANASVIGGGMGNTITNDSDYSTIAGGLSNWIGLSPSGSGPIFSIDYPFGLTIGGGIGNTNYGFCSTIPGGYQNYVSGSYSFAAGRRAKAGYDGSFVWADSTDADFASTAPNEFAIRARGGVRLSSDTPSINFGNQTRQMLNLWGTQYGIGVQSYLTYFRCDGSSPCVNGFAWYQGGGHRNGFRDAGGGVELMYLNQCGLTVNGSFVSVSDRNAKENFKPLDARVVLEKVAALPLSEWNYKQDPSARHVGPMAQDFHAAFGLGHDDKHIATVDADGVALAAIQGLNQKVEEQHSEIQELKNTVAELKELIAKLTSEKTGGAQ